MEKKNNLPEIIKLEDFNFDGDFKSNKIGVGEKLSSERLLYLAVEYKFKHLLQNSSADRDREVLTSAVMLDSPQLFFDFPLSTMQSPSKVSAATEKKLKWLEFKFKNGAEKDQILETIVKKLSEISNVRGLVSDVELVADELMCNAIFNAPFVTKEISQKKLKLSKPPPIKTAKIFVAKTDDEIIIGCEDSYGALDIVSLLERVQNCIKRSDGAGISNLGNYGAGLGTFMIFTLCSSMYFAVESKKRTLVCCSIPRPRLRRRTNPFSKTLHLIIPEKV